MTWERTAPELTDVEPASGWPPHGEPASVARLAYAPPNTDLPYHRRSGYRTCDADRQTRSADYEPRR